MVLQIPESKMSWKAWTEILEFDQVVARKSLRSTISGNASTRLVKTKSMIGENRRLVTDEPVEFEE